MYLNSSLSREYKLYNTDEKSQNKFNVLHGGHTESAVWADFPGVVGGVVDHFGRIRLSEFAVVHIEKGKRCQVVA